MRAYKVATLAMNAAGGVSVLSLGLLLVSCGRDTPASMDAAPARRSAGTALFAGRDDCCTPGEHLACQDGVFCNGEEQCDCWGNCEVGPPVNCDDGDHCTSDTCINDRIDPSGSYGEGHCAHICVPGPVCECSECSRHSDCDDGNACTIDTCDFGEGLCVHADRNCNDANICTEDDCDPVTGCVNTWIAGCCLTDGDCNDRLACTRDDCDEIANACSNDLMAGFCLIGGVCYPEGAVNPSGTCESCQTLVSTTGWTLLAAGTPCEDGSFCTQGDACDMFGNCIGSGDPCVDGIPCTDDTCDEVTDECRYPVRDGKCLIAGVCYNNGDVNPANTCQVCRSAASKTSWTPLAPGSACDDGLFCTVTDTCNAMGLCMGTGSSCSDGLVCTSDVCNEGSDTCSYPVMDGACLIGGRCYADNDSNPGNVCQRCWSATGKTAWSNRPAGASCDDGLFCNGTSTCNGSGTCVAGSAPCSAPAACATATCDEGADTCGFFINAGWCLIAGACYANNADNPANACQWCRSATSQISWGNKAPGAACNDGLFCTATDTCNGSGSCTGSGTPCGDGLVCTSDVCNEAADNCSYPVTGNYCLIGGTCYNNGQPNPTDPCQACNTTLTKTAWSGAVYGTACAGDAYACTDDICNGAGACIHPVKDNFCLIGTSCVAHGAANIVNACQWCDSTASKTAWTNKPYGAACAADTHTCTPDICDGNGLCIHPIGPPPGNDFCSGSTVMPQSGSGASMTWQGAGDSYCATDTWAAGSPFNACGAAAGSRDVFYSFTNPVEYQLYRYRVHVSAAEFNPILYFFGGDPGTPACGSTTAMLGCNETGDATCEAAGPLLPGYDANDPCFLLSRFVLPTGTHSIGIDTGGGTTTGGNHTIRVDRVGGLTNQTCITDQPEIQMGGTFTANTTDAAYWSSPWYQRGGLYSVISNQWLCTDDNGAVMGDGYTWTTPHIAALFHVNHTAAPWNLSRGYVISTDGTDTPSGYEQAIYFFAISCETSMWIVGCDQEGDHTRMASPSGHGARMTTGRIPAGKMAVVIPWAYRQCGSGPAGACGSGSWPPYNGNYALKVEIDDDGDGLPDTQEPGGCNGTMWGEGDAWGGSPSVPSINSCGGAISPGTLKAYAGNTYTYAGRNATYLFKDGATTGDYARNNPFASSYTRGPDKFYAVTVPANVQFAAVVQPLMKGDAWTAPVQYWDPSLLIYKPCTSGGMGQGWWLWDGYMEGGIERTGWLPSCGSAQTWYVGLTSWYPATGTDYRRSGYYILWIMGS
ncbi:MAG: hypothetical protein ABIJ56_01920 [Pseudomonadota bacterium]